MGPVLHPLSAHLENWRTLSLRIRCALKPDDPQSMGSLVIAVDLEHADLQRSQLEAMLDPGNLTAGRTDLPAIA